MDSLSPEPEVLAALALIGEGALKSINACWQLNPQIFVTEPVVLSLWAGRAADAVTGVSGARCSGLGATGQHGTALTGINLNCGGSHRPVPFAPVNY